MRLIILNSSQLKETSDCGRNRDAEALRQGKKNTHGLKCTAEESLNLHIHGAAAELAAALAVGVTWLPTVNTYKSKPDVEPDIDVRRRSTFKYDMLVRKSCPDNRRMIHVVGFMASYAVCGLKWTHHCKHDKWLQSYGGRECAYFIPLGELTPIGGPSVWHNENTVLEHFSGWCPHCGIERTLVVIQARWPRVDCAYCNRFVRWD